MRRGNRDQRWGSERQEFGLGDVVVLLCHGHGKKDTSKGRVNNGRGNLFNKRVETMKVENG